MLNASQAMRGQLVGVARSILIVYRLLMRANTRITANAMCPYEHIAQAHSDALDQLKLELARLVGNQFQLHNDHGDPVQLAVLIIFMFGEEVTI